MIYFDNAATTLKKPQAVISAVTEALSSMGNAGRGGYMASMDANRIVFDTRRLLADFFHGESPMRIAFTANATESLNIAIKGLFQAGDHVITTALEHNSVLRPLYEIEKTGVELTIIDSDVRGCINLQDFERSIRQNTKAIICTHASNLTGNLMPLKEIGQIAKAHHLLFLVDASQTAGIVPIDVQEMMIDVLCFTGHKGLLGPQGTGGIYVREGIEIRPLKTGGSGVQSFRKTHPDQMPTALEAGTLNVHGIAGLHAAIAYIQETGIERIQQMEQELMWYFYERVQQIPGIKVYGDFSNRARCPIVSLNVRDESSAQISDILYQEYDIATRPGAHCAPLMHEALGTVEQGAVRFSFSHHNTLDEVKLALKALEEIADT